MGLNAHLLSSIDRKLADILCDGLPLVEQPYAALAETLGINEAEVLARLRALAEAGVIRRFGVIVRHHELGYTANAMVVFDVPDAEVSAAGRRLAQQEGVNLCYRRPRRLPDWPYNLFCMVHGKDRDAVTARTQKIAEAAGLAHLPRQILFSTRRFKQRGARYSKIQAAE